MMEWVFKLDHRSNEQYKETLVPTLSQKYQSSIINNHISIHEIQQKKQFDITMKLLLLSGLLATVVSIDKDDSKLGD